MLTFCSFATDLAALRLERSAWDDSLGRVGGFAITARLAVVLIATLAVSQPMPAAGATITQCDEETQLRNAVAAGGSHIFDCTPGAHAIPLTSPLVVTKSVTLDATGQMLTVYNASGRVFEVNAGTLRVDNLRFQGLHLGGDGEDGGDGEPGATGANGENLPCDLSNSGLAPEDGCDGAPGGSAISPGGDGGDAKGGSIYIASGATVRLLGGTAGGQAWGGYGGRGGSGGDGGSGGTGGNAEGGWGCIFPLSTEPIHGSNGGSGAAGGGGAPGGDGGDARGGAVYVEAGGTLDVVGTTFLYTAALGGGGGHGGSGGFGGHGGGRGYGGCNTSVSCREGSEGLAAGDGGSSGAGGTSGKGLGGAIYSEGVVNLKDVIFSGQIAASGNGGRGGFGGWGGGNVSVPEGAGAGGDGGDVGRQGSSAGGAIYSIGVLNVFSATFNTVRATSRLELDHGGGDGGDGGNGKGGGKGGDGSTGGDASFASIAGAISYAGCADFSNDSVAAGTAGSGGKGGRSPGVDGSAGTAGTAGQIDPPGFAPLPCPEPPPQCSDGADNDGDGKIDFPDDPGCDSALDDSEPEPIDADGDGVPDADDSCPNLSGTGATGCPKISRTVSLRYRGDLQTFKGKVTSPEVACRDHQVVVVRERVPGRDRRVGSGETNARGKFAISAPRKPGEYYAMVRRNVLPTVGQCVGATSPDLILE